MAKNKKKIDQQKNKELEQQVHQDLLVRNMPKQNKAKGFKATKKTSQPQFNDQVSSPTKNNFKAIGFVIIFVGILFVIILIYLGYKYIIKPGVNTNTEVTTVVPTDNTSNVQNTIVVPETVSPVTSTSTTDVEIPVPVTVDDSTTVPKEIPVEEVANTPLLLDSDSDGLNDEEEFILGTNPELLDSDGDGYGDLSELKNGYNPSGASLLNENINISKYVNEALNYEIIYPTNWSLSTLNNGYTAIFSTTNESIVQISVQANPKIQNILSWYEESFPDSTVTYDLLKNTNTWDGIRGEDGFNFYLTDKDRKNIYVISFIPAVADQLTYPAILDLMINSLVIE